MPNLNLNLVQSKPDTAGKQSERERKDTVLLTVLTSTVPIWDMCLVHTYVHRNYIQTFFSSIGCPINQLRVGIGNSAETDVLLPAMKVD